MSNHGSITEFICGLSISESERAFRMNGNKVRFGNRDLSLFFNEKIAVASNSSINVNVGIDKDSVIVFVIYFWIPTIFINLSSLS